MLAPHDIFLQAHSEAKWLNEAKCTSSEGIIEPPCLTVPAQKHNVMLAPCVFILRKKIGHTDLCTGY